MTKHIQNQSIHIMLNSPPERKHASRRIRSDSEGSLWAISPGPCHCIRFRRGRRMLSIRRRTTCGAPDRSWWRDDIDRNARQPRSLAGYRHCQDLRSHQLESQHYPARFFGTTAQRIHASASPGVSGLFRLPGGGARPFRHEVCDHLGGVDEQRGEHRRNHAKGAGV